VVRSEAARRTAAWLPGVGEQSLALRHQFRGNLPALVEDDAFADQETHLRTLALQTNAALAFAVVVRRSIFESNIVFQLYQGYIRFIQVLDGCSDDDSLLDKDKEEKSPSSCYLVLFL
jgi:hypothetical protein